MTRRCSFAIPAEFSHRLLFSTAKEPTNCWPSSQAKRWIEPATFSVLTRTLDVGRGTSARPTGNGRYGRRHIVGPGQSRLLATGRGESPGKPWQEWRLGCSRRYSEKRCRRSRNSHHGMGSGGLSQIPTKRRSDVEIYPQIQSDAYRDLLCRVRLNLLLGDLIGREYWLC
jgi:hypothetical protein